MGKACPDRVAEEIAMELMNGFDSNYRYILVAARRARQLQSGAPPLVHTHSRKASRIAQEEINAGKIRFLVPGTEPSSTPPEGV